MAAAPSAAWRACFLVGVLGTACATAPPPAGNTTAAATPASSETVELSIGQPATALGGVRLALLEVQDQRCPVDVNCISAGYAKVTLEESTGVPTYQPVFGVAPRRLHSSLPSTVADWSRIGSRGAGVNGSAGAKMSGESTGPCDAVTYVFGFTIVNWPSHA